jgi:hypothetical protein
VAVLGPRRRAVHRLWAGCTVSGGIPGRRKAVAAAVACVALGAAAGGGVVAASGTVTAPKSCLHALDAADQAQDDLSTATNLLLRNEVKDEVKAAYKITLHLEHAVAILNGAKYVKASGDCRLVTAHADRSNVTGVPQ